MTMPMARCSNRRERMTGLGQTEKNSVRAYVFRFTPELGHCSSQSACLKRANNGSRRFNRSPRLHDQAGRADALAVWSALNARGFRRTRIAKPRPLSRSRAEIVLALWLWKPDCARGALITALSKTGRILLSLSALSGHFCWPLLPLRL